jgi:hypothetical protein
MRWGDGETGEFIIPASSFSCRFGFLFVCECVHYPCGRWEWELVGVVGTVDLLSTTLAGDGSGSWWGWWGLLICCIV